MKIVHFQISYSSMDLQTYNHASQHLLEKQPLQIRNPQPKDIIQQLQIRNPYMIVIIVLNTTSQISDKHCQPHNYIINQTSTVQAT